MEKTSDGERENRHAHKRRKKTTQQRLARTCCPVLFTCMVTRRSSTRTSLVKKSAPMVALYWLLNFLLTYWFISDVFPTLHTRTKEAFVNNKRTLQLISNAQVALLAEYWREREREKKNSMTGKA